MYRGRVSSWLYSHWQTEREGEKEDLEPSLERGIRTRTADGGRSS